MLLQTVRSEKRRVAEDMSPTSTESQPRLLNLSPRDVQKEYLLDMSPTPTKRVAIYARVSTFDKGKDRVPLAMLAKLVQARTGLLIFQHSVRNPFR